MLSIGKIRGSGQAADYYLDLAVRDDYYQKGGEPPGEWVGEGAEALGVRGQVGEEFRALLDGYSPDGKALVQNAGDEKRRPGFDLAFSAPKSISILWALSSPEIRRLIEDAQREAVKAALDYLQEVAAFSRTGKGGANIQKVGLIAAMFQHGTSRAQDPNLHTHLVLCNVGVREDGTTGALIHPPIFAHKMAAGAIYRAELSMQLEQRLNVEFERVKSWMEIKGVPEALMQTFSKRREEVLAALHDRGAHGAKAAEKAALSTRQIKGHIAREELFSQWQEVGREHSFTEKEIERLFRFRRPERSVALEMREAICVSLAQVMNQHSHFARKDFVRAVAEEAQTRGVGAKAVLHYTDRFLTSQEVIRLGEVEGQEHFTTTEMLVLEKAMLGKVEASRKYTHHMVRQTVTERVLAEYPTLKEEQKTAFLRMTQRPGSIQVINGMAGTGKSFTLTPAYKAWSADGYRVLGAALQAKTARRLKNETGIQSRTIASLLKRLESGAIKFDKRTVLVVDEAGMIGTRQMYALIDAAARRDAKLVLVGDAGQLQPIEAGGPFAAIANRLGKSELKEITRQRLDENDPNPRWKREAVHQFADGKAKVALEAYVARGLVAMAETREALRAALLSQWRQVGVQNPSDNLIIASENLEVTILNRHAQALRYKDNKLFGEALPLHIEEIYRGDRVIFKENAPKLGIDNGTLATVSHVDPGARTMTVILDGKHQERVTVQVDRYGAEKIKLGYATTTHAAQGETLENTFILLGSHMEDREQAYVKASRARGETRFFVDATDAGDDLKDLVRQLERSHRKDLAHDVRERQQHERPSV